MDAILCELKYFNRISLDVELKVKLILLDLIFFSDSSCYNKTKILLCKVDMDIRASRLREEMIR